MTPAAEYEILVMLSEHRGVGQRRRLCQDRTGAIVEDRPMSEKRCQDPFTKDPDTFSPPAGNAVLSKEENPAKKKETGGWFGGYRRV
jgi:hypothetical protein